MHHKNIILRRVEILFIVKKDRFSVGIAKKVVVAIAVYHLVILLDKGTRGVFRMTRTYLVTIVVTFFSCIDLLSVVQTVVFLIYFCKKVRVGYLKKVVFVFVLVYLIVILLKASRVRIKGLKGTTIGVSVRSRTSDRS